MTTGLLISFEGIDGAGKTTQLVALRAWLEERGMEVVTLREPGGTAVSESIRTLLLDVRNHIDPMAEALLYAAARAQLVSEMIRPALDRGVVVLADRFIDSTIAYQGYGRGLDLTALEQLNRLAARELEPDLTILLDIPATKAFDRRQGTTPDRLESEGLEFQSRVRDGYLILSRQQERIRVVDGTLPAVEVSREVIRCAEEFLLSIGGQPRA